MKLFARIYSHESAPQAQYLLPREGVSRSVQSQAQGEALSSEIIQLQKESDPELRSQGLLSVATREELRGDIAFATEAYAWLAEHGTGQTKEKAQERLGLLEGKGSFGQRAENLLRGFAQEASDPGMLLAMGVGGGVYKATKLATMSRLVGSSGYLGRGVGMKLAGSVAGYALEAPVFTGVGRLGRGEKLLGAGLKEELLSSYLVLGAMKTVGGVSRGISRGLGSPGLEKYAGDVGLYGGILLGHKLETVAGLRDWHSGGQEWVDGLAMLVQLKTSGRILNQLGGERYRRMERELDFRAERLAEWREIERLQAANDGEYQRPTLRIGMAADVKETPANDGGYPLGEIQARPKAMGGEMFPVQGIAAQPRMLLEFGDSSDGFRHLVFASGETNGESPPASPGGLEGRPHSAGGGHPRSLGIAKLSEKDRSDLGKYLGSGDPEGAMVAGDLYLARGDARGELIQLGYRLRDPNIQGPERTGIRKEMREIEEGIAQSVLKSEGVDFEFRWKGPAVASVEVARWASGDAVETLVDHLAAAKGDVRDLFRVRALALCPPGEHSSIALRNGRIRYFFHDPDFSSDPPFRRKFPFDRAIQEGGMPDLEVLHWSYAEMGDSEFSRLMDIVEAGGLPALKRLALRSNQLTGESLGRLETAVAGGRLEKIEELDIFSGNFSDAERFADRYVALMASSHLKNVARFSDLPSAGEASELSFLIIDARTSTPGLRETESLLFQPGADNWFVSQLLSRARTRQFSQLSELSIPRGVFDRHRVGNIATTMQDGGLSSLKSLSIGSVKVYGDGYRPIFRAFQDGRVSDLEALDIQAGGDQRVIEWLPLAEAIRAGALPKLKALAFGEITFVEGQLEQLIGALTFQGPSKLERLSLTNAFLSEANLEPLYGAISEGAFPQLREIHLAGNGLGQGRSSRLANAILEGRLSHLEKVDLTRNRLVIDNASFLHRVVWELGINVLF